MTEEQFRREICEARRLMGLRSTFDRPEMVQGLRNGLLRLLVDSDTTADRLITVVAHLKELDRREVLYLFNGASDE